MNRVAPPTRNDVKTTRVWDVLSELLKQTLRNGFHGSFKVEVVVNDGVIQYIRHGLERTEK